MSGFTKINPVGGIQLNTLYSTLQLKVFKLVFVDALVAGLDTLGLPVAGGNPAERKTADLMAQEFGTTGALFHISADGKTMIVIGDGHALDINTVARRADNVLGGAGTLTGDGTTAKVTVTQATTLAGL